MMPMLKGIENAECEETRFELEVFSRIEAEDGNFESILMVAIEIDRGLLRIDDDWPRLDCHGKALQVQHHL
jgi:hypothetical protein